MISTPEIDLLKVWADLQSTTQLGTSLRRLHPTLQFHASIRVPERTLGLQLVSGQPIDLDVSELRGSEMIKLDYRSDDGRTIISLEAAPGANEDVFKKLCADVVPRVNESASDEVAAGQMLVRRFNTWLRHLKPAASGILSEKRQLGLYGELVTLKDLLLANLDVSVAVEAWVGPARAIHDFQWGGMAVEVKSVVHSQPQVLIIDGERQLDDFGLEALLIAHHRMESTRGAGELLPDIIDEIRGLIEKASGPRDTFDESLLAVGYHDADAESHYRSRGFNARSTSYYRVRPGFPRIIEPDLKLGVGGVRYSLVASSCKDFEVDADTVVSWIREPTSLAPVGTDETRHIEYKETAWTPTKPVPDENRGHVANSVRTSVVKTIVGFMNAQGGELVIGVRDDKTVAGIAPDLRSIGAREDDFDTYQQKILELLGNNIDSLAHASIRLRIEDEDDGTICRVVVAPSPSPKFGRALDSKSKARPTFWVRAENTTTALEGRELVEYIGMHWS